MRIGWCVVFVIACKAPAPDVVEAAAPKPSGPDLVTAVRVDVRETSDADGKRGDVVLALERTGDHFDWEGKGVPFPSALGERIADPLTHSRCSCDPTRACPRCDGIADADLVKKNGSASAAAVEGFLGEAMRHPVAENADAGERDWARVDMVHVAITLPGVDEPVHISYFDSRHAWMRDDKPLAGDMAALDAAWATLAGQLGLDAWLASMSPARVSALPADFASLASAETIEIHDAWNGLGKTHDLVARLERTPSGFKWRAKIAPWSGSIGESTPDPYDPKDKSQKICTCAVDDSCPCESRADALHETGTVAASAVEAFLKTVSTHGIDPSPPMIGRSWTDDYPKGHVVVWVTKGSAPIHLSFLDQQRQWRANGRVLSPDGPRPVALEMNGQHVVINTAYRAMLDALGYQAWVEEAHEREHAPRRTR